MPDDIVQSVSPRFALPFLFAGQAQKEMFVNEALSRIDAVLAATVLGMAVEPPSAPAQGDCWIIAESASGAWTDRDHYLASWSGSDWFFIDPPAGMAAREAPSGRQLFFDGLQWSVPPQCPEPLGGEVVDSEMRGAFATLLQALRTAGVISA